MDIVIQFLMAVIGLMLIVAMAMVIKVIFLIFKNKSK
jgi:hypothetical protein